MEYQQSPETAVEALISINNQLRQPEAAVGILNIAQRNLVGVRLLTDRSINAPAARKPLGPSSVSTARRSNGRIPSRDWGPFHTCEMRLDYILSLRHSSWTR
jgi:hypothetical protein